MTDNNEAVDLEKKVQAEETSKDSEKMVSVAEMQRRLKQEQEKHQLEMSKTQKDIQNLIDEAVSKAKMSDEELQSLKEQEAIQAIEKENQSLKAEIAYRKMQDLAIKELESQGVPVNESTLAFVVKDNEEATKSAVISMANILNTKKREEAKSSAPITSGGTDDRSRKGKDKFASAKITNF